MGLQEGVKEFVRKYSLVVVYVVVGDILCVYVYVESFECVEVRSFFVVSYYLHCVVDGAEWVVLFNEVLCKL